MDIQPLTPNIGAQISGVQLNQTLSNQHLSALHDALLKHQVLFFRDQHISAETQRDLAQSFGQLHIHPIYPPHERVPEIMVLDSHLQDLKDNELWHTDVTFLAEPAMGCVLSAKQVPSFGGDTLWASLTQAYADLSLPMQQFLLHLSAQHDIARSFPNDRFAQTPDAQAKLEAAKAKHPPLSHPVVRTHPITGEKALFISEGFTTRINELSQAESDVLLAFLFRHSTQPKYFVRWHWQNGDVAIWDNRCTQHFANFDYGNFRRIMHRATIVGDKPF
jgi:taurine dioxygenase